MQPRSRLCECTFCESRQLTQTYLWKKGSTNSTTMQWDKSVNATCAVNVPAFFIGNAVPNIITDWALLLLPIPYIWRLHQRRAQKVALCGVFGLGGL